jgi:hypothetical protein
MSTVSPQCDTVTMPPSLVHPGIGRSAADHDARIPEDYPVKRLGAFALPIDLLVEILSGRIAALPDDLLLNDLAPARAGVGYASPYMCWAFSECLFCVMTKRKEPIRKIVAREIKSLARGF